MTIRNLMSELRDDAREAGVTLTQFILLTETKRLFFANRLTIQEHDDTVTAILTTDIDPID